MKFLVLILVLGLRRLEVSWPQWLTLRSRHQTWLQSLGNRLGNGPLLYLLAVLLPAVLLALLGCALQGFWAQWLWLLMALLVLVWLMGGQSEFRHVDELLVRGRMNDPEGFAALASEEFGVTGDPTEIAYQEQLSERALAREFRVFAVIFWLMVLGLPGAFLWVMNQAWLQRVGVESSAIATLHRWMSWPVQRLLVLSMALAGDFAAVMDSMRHRWFSLANSDEAAASLLLDAARAASDLSPIDEQSSLLERMQPMEELQGLVLRCVAIWLITCALWVLLA